MTEERNTRGQLLVTYPEWQDISTVAKRAGVDRYNGYLIIKKQPSTQRVEFTNAPADVMRIDLAAIAAEADAAITAYQEAQTAKAARKARQQQARAEAVRTLPERDRKIAEAQNALGEAKRALSLLAAQARNEIAKRRGALRSQCNADLRAAVNTQNEAFDAARADQEAQVAELYEFFDLEKVTIEARYDAEVAELSTDLEADIQALPGIVAKEQAVRVAELNATVAEAEDSLKQLRE